jgi:hypothetical protein
MIAPGKKLLFWDEQIGGALQPLLDALHVTLRGSVYGQPKDHVRRNVPRADREQLARALQLRSSANPTGGEILMAYMGWADCRICGEKLGTRDFCGYGFVWPELADHYVLTHDVWTPECGELLAAVKRSQIPRRPA